MAKKQKIPNVAAPIGTLPKRPKRYPWIIGGTFLLLIIGIAGYILFQGSKPEEQSLPIQPIPQQKSTSPGPEPTTPKAKVSKPPIQVEKPRETAIKETPKRTVPETKAIGEVPKYTIQVDKIDIVAVNGNHERFITFY